MPSTSATSVREATSPCRFAVPPLRGIAAGTAAGVTAQAVCPNGNASIARATDPVRAQRFLRCGAAGCDRTVDVDGVSPGSLVDDDEEKKAFMRREMR